MSIPLKANDGTAGRRTERSFAEERQIRLGTMRHAINNENRIDPLTACPTCGRSLVDEFADVAVDHDRYEIHAGDKIVRLTKPSFRFSGCFIGSADSWSQKN